MMVAAIMIVVMIMVVLADEEVRLDVENAIEIEGAALKHVRNRDVAFLRSMERRVGIDRADARLHLTQFGRADEIGLIDNDDVGKGDLVLGFRRIAQPLGEPFGVGDRDHRVEPRRFLHVLIDEEGLRHRRRIGEPCRFDDDCIELGPCVSSGPR